ncbi:serine/threonine-protein phosphatase [bacterium]|nr:serine/threonine-protein phosphatase [bacterium]
MNSVDVFARSDIGLVRSNNEDAFLVIPPWRDQAISNGVCCFAVADGMGGHKYGEIAAKLAMDCLKTWLRKSSMIKGLSKLSTSLVEEIFGNANSAIWEFTQSHPETHGMGTTFTLALVKNDQLLLGHVGDSRAYLLRNSKLQQLTRDHSFAAEQVRLGFLTKEQAQTHPARNYLIRAMGVREFITPDSEIIDLQPGDTFILCSDGIYNQVPEEQIQRGLENTYLDEIPKLLIKDSIKAGGKDNATAVIFRFNEVPVSFPGQFSFSRFKACISEWWQGTKILSF